MTSAKDDPGLVPLAVETGSLSCFKTNLRADRLERRQERFLLQTERIGPGVRFL